MCTVDEKVQQKTDLVVSTHSIPTVPDIHNSTSDYTLNASNQEQTPTNPQNTTIEIASSTEQQSLRHSILAATPAGPTSPPSPMVTRSLYQLDNPPTSNLHEFSPAVSVSGNTQIHISPRSSQPTSRTWAQLAQQNSQAWVSLYPETLR